MSITTIASASSRTRLSEVHSSRGCAAASPSRAAATTIAATAARRTRGLGSGRPIARRTDSPRRWRSASATSGTTTTTAISAPSGVSSVRSISTRCRARRRRRRATPCRRRDGFLPAAASVGSRPWPRCSISWRLYFASSFSGSRRDRLLEARDRGEQELGAVLLLRPLRRGRVPGGDRDDAEQARGAGAEHGIGVVDDDRLQPLGQLGPAGSPAPDRRPCSRGACSAAARGASGGRRRRPGRRARARRHRTAPAPAGSSRSWARRRRSGRRRPGSRCASARRRPRRGRGTRAPTTQAAADDEQQLARQVRQPAPHAAAFRRAGTGSASRPA